DGARIFYSAKQVCHKSQSSRLSCRWQHEVLPAEEYLPVLQPDRHRLLSQSLQSLHMTPQANTVQAMHESAPYPTDSRLHRRVCQKCYSYARATCYRTVPLLLPAQTCTGDWSPAHESLSLQLCSR